MSDKDIFRIKVTNKPIRWRNGSREKPSKLMPTDDFTLLLDIMPTMESPYSGTVVLKGRYSYGFYNGHYYFLEPMDVYDLEEEIYTYAMVRDLWSDCLMQKITVMGTLKRTTDKQALEDNFHLTNPLIDNASQIEYLNLGEQEKGKIAIKGLEQFTYEFRPEWQFPIMDITFTGVLSDAHSNGKSNFVNIKSIPSWKYYVYDKVLQTKKDIESGKYTIAQVGMRDTKINGMWSVTEKMIPLGTAEEVNTNLEIDLGGLVDIESLNPIDLTTSDPNVTYTELSEASYTSSMNYEIKDENLKLFTEDLVTKYKKPYVIFHEDFGPYDHAETNRIKKKFQWENLNIEVLENKNITPRRNQLMIVDEGNEFRRYFTSVYTLKEDTKIHNIVQFDRIQNIPLKEQWLRLARTDDTLKGYIHRADSELSKYNNYYKPWTYWEGYGRWWWWWQDIDPRPKENWLTSLPKKENGEFDLESIYSIIPDWFLLRGRRHIPWYGRYEYKGFEADFQEVDWNQGGAYWHAAGRLGGIKKLIAYGWYGAEFMDKVMLEYPNTISQSVKNDYEPIKRAIFEKYGINYKEGKYFNLTKKDIEKGFHLFDLKGTQWYFCLQNKIGHFILKSSDLVDVSGTQVYELPKQAQIYNKPIYERINQRIFLQIYTTNYDLKTRIQRPTDFNVKLTKILVPDKLDIEDNFRVEVNTFNDAINESISIPKPLLNVNSIDSLANYKRTMNEMIWQNDDFTQRQREMRHSRVSEDYEFDNRWFNWGLQTASNIINTFGLGLGMVTHPWTKKSTNDSKVNYYTNNIYSAYTGAVMQGIDSARQYYELSNQQAQMLEGRIIENMRFDLEHKKIQMSQKHQIREMSTIRERSSVNSRVVAETTARIMKTTPIHVKCYTPSSEQMWLINEHYKRFGVECLVPNFWFFFLEDQVGVWEFETIDFINVEEPALLAYIEGILIAGIRIIDYDNLSRLDGRNYGLGEMLVPVKDRYLELRQLRAEVAVMKEKSGNIDKCYEDLEKCKEDTKKIVELEREKERNEEFIKELKDDLRKSRKDYEYKAEQLKNILRERNKFAEEIVDLKDDNEKCKKRNEDLEQRPTQFQLDEAVKEASNKIWNRSIKETRILYRKNARLQSEAAGLKDRLAECNERVKKLTSGEAQQEQERCLARYKQAYQNLFKLYKNVGNFFFNFLYWYMRSVHRYTKVINPGIYNNSWYAANYRNWAGKDLGEAIIASWNHMVEWYYLLKLPLAIQVHLKDSKQDLKDYEHYNNLYKLAQNIDSSKSGLAWFLEHREEITRLDHNYADIWLTKPAYWGLEGVVTYKGESYNKNILLKSEVYDDPPPTPEELETCARDVQPVEGEIENVREVEHVGRVYLGPEEQQENERKIQEFKDSIAALTAAVNRLKSQESDESEALTACQNNLSRFEQNFPELENKIKTQQNEILLYKNQLEVCKKDLATSKSNFQKCRENVQRLTEENKRLQDEIAAKVLEALQKDADIKQLQIDIKTKDTDIEHFKEEKTTAIAELNKLKNFFTADPIQADTANENQKKTGAIGVGKNFQDMTINAFFLAANIRAMISDYKNRVRSNQQVIANVGWYFNYLMDSIDRVLKQLITNKETQFIIKNKLGENNLRGIRQKRDAENKPGPVAPEKY